MPIGLSPIGNDAAFILSTGVAASGAKLFIYASGSTTKSTTYQDSGGAVQNANPVVLNSSGYPASGGNVVEIWLTTGSSYKFVLAPSTDTDPPASPYWSRDNVPVLNDPMATSSEWQGGSTPTFISSSSFSVAGDQTTTFTIGRRIKATVTAGTVYGRITNSVFGSVTTVTVQMDGTQALDSGMSAISYALLGSLVKSEPERIATSSGTDTYTATVGITRLVLGDEFKVKIASTNTSTTPTLNLDSTGAKTVVRADGSALLAGDLNGEHIFRWNGTNQIVLNPLQVKTTQISQTQTAGTIFAGPASGAAAAPTFQTASSYGSSLQLLGSKTASSTATISFVQTAGTGDVLFDWTAYDLIILEFVQLIPVNNATLLQFQISQDSGSTYKNGGTAYASTALTWTSGGALFPAASTSAGNITSADGATGPQSNSTNYGLSGFLRIMKPSNAIKKFITADLSYLDSGSAYRNTKTIVDYNADSNAINGIKFFYNSGNISSGTIYAYGLRKA